MHPALLRKDSLTSGPSTNLLASSFILIPIWRQFAMAMMAMPTSITRVFHIHALQVTAKSPAQLQFIRRLLSPAPELLIMSLN